MMSVYIFETFYMKNDMYLIYFRGGGGGGGEMEGRLRQTLDGGGGMMSGLSKGSGGQTWGGTGWFQCI